MYAGMREIQNIKDMAGVVRRIAYIPHEDMGNAYTDRMREILSNLGVVYRFPGLRRLFKGWPHSLGHYDLVFINWLENAIVDADSGRIDWRAVFKLFAKTLLIKAFARRLVFIRHNNYPHDTAAGSEQVAQRLIDAYEHLFDRVITHSGAAAGRRYYCPHPLYQAIDSAAAYAHPEDLPAGYFLVFGRIQPYKKIDALLAAWPVEQTLVVAGSVGDAAYARRLSVLQGAHFIFRPGRLEEVDAQRMMRAARGVVIANAEADVVVSGTFFYAMSLGCPVYAVASPFLLWARERLGSELLVLGNNLNELCQLIADARPPATPVSAAALEAIQREFGDMAVLSALTAVTTD